MVDEASKGWLSHPVMAASERSRCLGNVLIPSGCASWICDSTVEPKQHMHVLVPQCMGAAVLLAMEHPLPQANDCVAGAKGMAQP